MNSELVEFIRSTYKTNGDIPLHAPKFLGAEKENLKECLDSTFVSSVGPFVSNFEMSLAQYTGAAQAVATVNGSAALSAALYSAGVERNDLIITQALNFVALGNAIYHLGAMPIFLDVSPISLSLSPKAVSDFLSEFAEKTDDGTIHRHTKQRIRALVPMHTFGHPAEIDELISICENWSIKLIEDAAESLGSLYKGNHCGTFGEFGCLSFNGNKIITTGGGGMILCKSSSSGKRIRHITTTAKVPHPYEFYHDEPGFNYRMPNINAALGCGQMENLETYLNSKRDLALRYAQFFDGSEFRFVVEPPYAKSNYWLNSIICPSEEARNSLLQLTNNAQISTRPVWDLLSNLPMFRLAERDDLVMSKNLAKTLVSLPSSPIVE